MRERRSRGESEEVNCDQKGRRGRGEGREWEERGGERKRNIKSVKYQRKSLFIERYDPIDILR